MWLVQDAGGPSVGWPAPPSPTPPSPSAAAAVYGPVSEVGDNHNVSSGQ